MQISCRNVTLGYDRPIVEDLNFNISKKDYLLVLGENGAGKSTLIKTLLGLIPTLKGSIEFTGGLQKNEIGYLPQQTNFKNDFPATVSEIVLSGCLNKQKLFYSKEQKALALANMEKLGITSLKTKSFRNLSGGQRQKVLLARALCATDKVLLLDEPVTGLDKGTTAELYKTIKRLNDETTIIMVSHDTNFPIDNATHILQLGREKFFCTNEEYLQKESLK